MSSTLLKIKRHLESERKKRERIKNVRKACRITDQVFSQLIPELKIGMTEEKVSSLVNQLVAKNGCEWLAFDTIVVSGKRGHLIHGKPSDKKIKKGDFVTLDFGVKVNDYCSDMTRTLFFGKKTDISTKQKSVYNLVLKAQKEALSEVKKGVMCFNLDYTARNIIKEKGYDEFFIHGLGHGVTKDIHAAPTLNKQSTEILKEGDIITIEPGIYIPDELGVRIEDTVLVKENGYEILTTSKKSLIYIEK